MRDLMRATAAILATGGNPTDLDAGDAYNAGYHAGRAKYRHGRDIICPYAPGSALRREWEQGRRDAIEDETGMVR